MIDVLFIAILIAFFALMVAFVRLCEHIVGKEDARPALRRHRPTTRRPTRPDTAPTATDRGGPGMKSYDNLVGLIISVLVTAYLIYALIAPEKL